MTNEAFLQISEYYLTGLQASSFDFRALIRTSETFSKNSETFLQFSEHYQTELQASSSGFRALIQSPWKVPHRSRANSANLPASIPVLPRFSLATRRNQLLAQEQHTPTSTNPPSTNKPDDPTRAPHPRPQHPTTT